MPVLSPEIPVYTLPQDTVISVSRWGARTSDPRSAVGDRLGGTWGLRLRGSMCAKCLVVVHTEALWECGEDGEGSRGIQGKGPEGLETQEPPESSPLPPLSTTEGRRAPEGVRGGLRR